MASEEEERAVDEFMNEHGRASDWEMLRGSLSSRLQSLRAERAATTLPAAISTLDKRIAGIAEQVAVLETEEVVARFVEDSVRATIRANQAE